MIIQYIPLEKVYPYLCVLTLGDHLNAAQIKTIKNEDILVISLVKENHTDDEPKPYVSSLSGSKIGYFTKKESDYFRLPTGFEVKITQ